MSTSTTSVEIQESLYEDPDALLSNGAYENQAEVKAKPVPAPRLKLYQQTQQISTSNNSYANAYAATSGGYSAGFKRPKPSRPPPPPPVKNESGQTSNTQPPVKPPHIHIELPPPPPRPARSPEYSDRLSFSATQRNEKIPPPLPLKPPPLLSSRRGSTYSETDNLYLEILPDNPDETDLNELLNWFNRMLAYSGSMPLSLYGLSKEDTMSSVCQKAMNAKRAWNLFNLLMMKRKEDLQKIITEFRSISEHLNKLKKKNKTMGIAGGTTGAVGGVATVVGIALAPVTFGTSLIATAVGAGMIASAGGMGAHAAIANRKTVTREAVEKLVNDYKDGVTDLERCLDFIFSTAMELQRHGVARLESAGAHPDAVTVAYKLHNVLKSMDIYGRVHARAGGMTSEKLLQAFTKEMDLFFTEKYGQKLKKSNKSIFSAKVSLLADGLKEGLDHLVEMWEKLS